MKIDISIARKDTAFLGSNSLTPLECYCVSLLRSRCYFIDGEMKKFEVEEKGACILGAAKGLAEIDISMPIEAQISYVEQAGINALIDYWRHQKTEAGRFAKELKCYDLAVESERTAPYSRSTDPSLYAQADEFLASLSTDDRDLFQLHYERWKFTEIALLRGVHESTIRRKLKRIWEGSLRWQDKKCSRSCSPRSSSR